MLDHETRETGQNAARKGAERGQQAELAGRCSTDEIVDM
jgi:hypothetical protein